MIEYEAHSNVTGVNETSERRSEPREPAFGALWMVDHEGETVLRCQCLEASRNGLRLRVPLGYGVAEGQRYELRSHLPGALPITEGFDLMGSRWATVVRAQMRVNDHGDYLEVGVALDEMVASPISFAAVKPALV